MKIIIAIIVIIIISIGIYFFKHKQKNTDTPSVIDTSEAAPLAQPNTPPAVEPNNQSSPPPPQPAAKPEENTSLKPPISRWQERVTKKPFGLKVTKENSPITPERFSGIHSGTDFETFADEQETEVTITAICDGPLKVKKTVSGYGGLAIQACTLNGSAVTILYGHLKLSSITAAVGTTLKTGDAIGTLGKGYSSETDNERKHLHLGIHKGSSIVYAGYVQKESELSAWIDPAQFLQ